MARKLKWEVAQWSQNSDEGDCIAITPLAGTSRVVLLAASAVEASPRDGIWVERIIGQVFHVANDHAAEEPQATNIKERIQVGFEPTAAGSPLSSNPWVLADANERFLWERTQGVRTKPGVSAGAYIFSDSIDIPWWNTIDVRVGRYLRAQDALLYTIACDPAIPLPVTTDVYTWGWFRLLISE